MVGIALFYQKYSTWNGRRLYLEDPVVTETERAWDTASASSSPPKRQARMRLHAVAGPRSNEPAIGFYRSLGSAVEGEWLNGRPEGEAPSALARHRHELGGPQIEERR